MKWNRIKVEGKINNIGELGMLKTFSAINLNLLPLKPINLKN